jgi:CRP-like cAMP-binding protein
MKAKDFVHELERGGALRSVLQRFSQALVNQISQSVLCTNLHRIDRRLARWLLMTHDRAGTDEFELTQQFVAQMLAVRRPSVTVAAGILQKAGAHPLYPRQPYGRRPTRPRSELLRVL